MEWKPILGIPQNLAGTELWVPILSIIVGSPYLKLSMEITISVAN